MAKTPTTNDIPTIPTARRRWILYQLDLRGLNFSEIAREIGCSRQAVSLAASGYPIHDIEAALATKLGLPHATLFREHFDRKGNRLPLVKASNRKHGGARLGNIQSPELA